MLGLFDRPTTDEEINALRSAGILGLSDRVAACPDEWNSIVSRLRRAGLINEASSDKSDDLDAHPIIRAYFAARLQQDHAMVWQKGHAVLYQHKSQRGGQPPKKLEDLIPYYQAVRHASFANMLQDALKNVYWEIIQQKRGGYAHRIHGAFATELTMLRSCFEDKNWEQPKLELDPFWQAHVLGTAGSRLRALGKLKDAVKPFLASRERHKQAGHSMHAAIRTRHLCELHVELGKLEDATDYGEAAVKLASKIDKSFADILKSADKGKGKSQYQDSNIEGLTKQDGKYELLVANVVLAAALHQQGEWGASNGHFLDAVRGLTSKPKWRNVNVLFGLWGFRYCEYLFDVAEWRIGGPNVPADAYGLLKNQIKKMNSIQEKDLKNIPEGGLGTLGPNLTKLIELRPSCLNLRLILNGEWSISMKQ